LSNKLVIDTKMQQKKEDRGFWASLCLIVPNQPHIVNLTMSQQQNKLCHFI